MVKFKVEQNRTAFLVLGDNGKNYGSFKSKEEADAYAKSQQSLFDRTTKSIGVAPSTDE